MVPQNLRPLQALWQKIGASVMTNERPDAGMDESDLELRRRQLGARLEVNAEETVRREKSSSGGLNEAGRSYGLVVRFVSELVAGALVGGVIGWGLDRLFSTGPIFLVIFLLLGFAAGVSAMIKSAKK